VANPSIKTVFKPVTTFFDDVTDISPTKMGEQINRESFDDSGKRGENAARELVDANLPKSVGPRKRQRKYKTIFQFAGWGRSNLSPSVFIWTLKVSRRAWISLTSANLSVNFFLSIYNNNNDNNDTTPKFVD
jgi:hypothetical protein